MLALVPVAGLSAARAAPPAVVSGPACSEHGAVSTHLGGTAEAGVTDAGPHRDLDVSLGAVVRPGRLRCAPSEGRSQF